jgi:hypothetical protein
MEDFSVVLRNTEHVAKSVMRSMWPRGSTRLIMSSTML